MFNGRIRTDIESNNSQVMQQLCTLQNCRTGGTCILHAFYKEPNICAAFQLPVVYITDIKYDDDIDKGDDNNKDVVLLDTDKH